MASSLNTETGLQEQIAAYMNAQAGKGNPEAAAAREHQIEQLIQSKAIENSLQQGQTAPDFSLPNVDGVDFTLSAALKKGSVVVTFYRGDWCPFCNLTLRAYERILPQISALGAALVAISPQTPDYSLLTAQHKELTYPVLSDVGNQVARRFGLVYTLTPELRRFYSHIVKYNGEDSGELPMTGTYVINTQGIVTLAHVDADYRRRLEPDAILAALKVESV